MNDLDDLKLMMMGKTIESVYGDTLCLSITFTDGSWITIEAPDVITNIRSANLGIRAKMEVTKTVEFKL